jgi:4-phytase/acid phosphatase/peptide/nickel transport system substrate-binding protein
MLNPANRFRGRSFFEPIQAVSKIDEFTVQFRLTHAWLPFPQILSGTRGLSMSIPSAKAVEEDKQLRTPVGTGPFIFKEWIAGDRLVVKRNPHYWQEGRPYLDEIVFKILPDHQTRFVSLKSGQMDLIWMDRGTIIQQAEKDSNLVLYQGEGNGAEIFVLNTTKPPFNDARVRRAIAHAWNQEACVTMSYNKAIPMALHPFGKEMNCYDVGYPRCDPTEAKRLMTEYGKPVEIECLHSNTKRGNEQGELLQHFCKEIGVVVKPVGLSFGPVIKKVITKDYQISTWRIPSGTDMGPLLYGAFHSQSRLNVSGYNNPEVDDLLMAQRMEPDARKRNQMLCDIAGIINRDVPIIYRGGRRYHVIARPEVKGIPKFRNGVVQLSEAWLEK